MIFADANDIRKRMICAIASCGRIIFICSIDKFGVCGIMGLYLIARRKYGAKTY